MANLSLAPEPLNIYGVRAGDKNAVVFTLLAGGSPWDLSDCVVSAQARGSVTDVEPALTATVEMLVASEGVFRLVWPGDDVSALLAGAASWSGVWDLQVVEAGGLPVTVVAGVLRCDADVTR